MLHSSRKCTRKIIKYELGNCFIPLTGRWLDVILERFNLFVCVCVCMLAILCAWVYLFIIDFLKRIFMIRNNCSEYSGGADPSGWNSYSKKYISYRPLHLTTKSLRTEIPLIKIVTNIINIVIIAISFLTVKSFF